MAESGVNDLLVEIRASADKYSDDLKRIRTESTTLVNSLKTIGDPLKTFGNDAKKAGETLERSFGDAHASLFTLEQMLGVHLPRAVTRFAAESETIGPLLSAAFSSVAVVGLITVLAEMPEAINKISEAISGWNEKSAKAFDDFLKAQREATAAAEEFKVKLLEVQTIGLSGSTKEIAQANILQTQIHDKTEELKKNFAAQDELEKKLNAQKKITEDLAKLGHFDPAAGIARLADEGKLLGLQKDEIALNDQLKKLTTEMAVAQRTVNVVQGTEAVAALDLHKKSVAELLNLNKQYSKSWSDLLQQLRTGGMVSGAEDIAAGLKAADVNAKGIIATYIEIRKLQLELINLNKAYLEFWDQKLQEIRTKGMVSGGDDVKAGLDAADRTAKKIIDAAEKTKKAGQDLIDHGIDDLSRMWTTMIANNEKFWDAFKHLGTAAIAAVADTFLARMLHNALDPLAASIGKRLGGAAAGSSGGSSGESGAKFSLSGLVKGGAIAAAATAAIIGIEKVGSAIVHLFGQMRRAADEFVKSAQNPFQQSVTDLFKGLEDARALGQLTVAEVKNARVQFESMWTAFQAQAKAAGVVGQQALATVTPFIAQWESWLDGLDLAAASLEHMNKVLGFMSRVTDAAKDSEALNEAIATMQQNGQSAASIIQFLGSDILSMVDAMKALGMEIPAGISGIYDMIQAISRIAEIDNELKSVTDQLTSTIIRKLDFLDAQIEKSQQNLKDFEAQKQEIQTLEDKIQRNALVKALERAKATGGAVTSLIQSVVKGVAASGHKFTELNQHLQTTAGNTAAVAAAQKALDDFDAAMTEKQNQADIDRLASLKRDLPLMIEAEKKHIEELERSKEATEELAKAMGISRKNEFDDINDTINALIARGQALETERNGLLALAQSAESATNAFAALAEKLAQMARAELGPPLLTKTQTPAEQFHQFAQSYIGLIPHFTGGGVMPYTGLAHLEKGETVTPAGDQRPIEIHIHGELMTEDQALRKLTRGIDRMVQHGSLTLTASKLKR